MNAATGLRLLLFAVVLSAASARGDVLLVDERVDSQQVTEVRFDAPAGCVITGLGLRAHEDNITTMHCRYHRLRANGKLSDAKEVRLGYQPDNPCEAKIWLPEGWVAVGFGAAGEPEWDVTLLRVWARPLLPDGTLGEVQEFSDGRNPERGPERFVVLAEPDRVLTGVGTRLHFNDIASVYARSQRVVPIGREERQRIAGFGERAWMLDGFDARRVEWLRGMLQRHGTDRLYVRLADAPSGPRTAVDVDTMQALVALGREHGVEVHVWLADPYRRPVAGVPGLAGALVDLAGAKAPWSARNLDALRQACEEHGKPLALRIDAGTALPEGLPADTGLIVRGGVDPELAATRTVLVELDLAGTWPARAGLPDVRIGELSGVVASAALAGAKGYCARIAVDDRPVTDTENVLNLLALERLVRDPLHPSDALWETLCAARYGKTAPEAKAALQLALQANALLLKILGLPVLWDDAGMRSVAEARSWLEQRAARSDETATAAQSLLAPSDGVLNAARDEKNTARWLLSQAAGAAERAATGEAAPPEAHLLRAAVRRAEYAARFWQPATEVFLLAQMYGLDGADRTREAAIGAMEALRTAADEANAAIGENPYSGHAGAFITGAAEALEAAETGGPLVRAFERVRGLAEEGKSDEAARALAQVLTHEAFLPHLDKRNETLGELASSLDVLLAPDAGLRVVRGADGGWVLAEVDGRWAFQTVEKGYCVYFDVPGEPLAEPRDYTLSFEYYDAGSGNLWVHYDSAHDAGEQPPQYHPAEPVPLTDTKAWKQASRELSRCRFSSGQNVNADLRFIADELATINIRHVHLEPKS